MARGLLGGSRAPREISRRGWEERDGGRWGRMWLWRRERGVVEGEAERGRSGREEWVKRIIRGTVDILVVGRKGFRKEWGKWWVVCDGRMVGTGGYWNHPTTPA